MARRSLTDYRATRVDIGASNPGLRDGTKLERFSCWEALLQAISINANAKHVISRDSSDLIWNPCGKPCSEKIVASLVPK